MLTMMGEMLVRVLCKDDVDDKLKSVREDFLDNLEVSTGTCTQISSHISRSKSMFWGLCFLSPFSLSVGGCRITCMTFTHLFEARSCKYGCTS